MSARAFLLAGACVFASSSCARSLPPSGQIVLFVDTDAPVPPGTAAKPDLARLSSLVDRARFEVLADGKTLAGSSRDFALDEDLLRAQKLSFGISPAPNDGAVSVRVRLFRADRSTDELPAGVTLDTTVTLPPVADDGVLEVSAVLRVDDFGRSIGPVAATPGRPARSLVGTWRGGRHVSCAAPPASGQACVPGGSFFFGDPAFRGRTAANDIVDERLVWISPFYLDTTEVTVGAFRASWPALAAVAAQPPDAFYPPRNSNQQKDFCTWSDSPTVVDGVPLDKLPLNCVSWNTARAYCRAHGGDLPSEAQLEYVSSGLGEEWAFPWGNDESDCSGAVWGRGGTGFFVEGSSVCRTPGTLGWLAFPGSGTRDRLDPTPESGGDPELLDLGGNLAEWAVDMWSRPAEPFWSPVLPMVDPVSPTLGVDGDVRPARGGSWPTTVLATRAAFRTNRGPADTRASVGFRCARPAQPGPPGGG